MLDILSLFARNLAIDYYIQSPARWRSRSRGESMHPKIVLKLAAICFFTFGGWQLVTPANASNLPADNDIPEEVLRAEIITEARSPIDGKALSASQFAELVIDTQQQLDRENASAAISDSKFKDTIFLLRLRGFLRSIGIPIK
jgi:hypothetical protein